MAQVVSVLRRSKCSKFKSPGMGKIIPTKSKEQSYFRHVFQEATTDWSKMMRTKLVTRGGDLGVGLGGRSPQKFEVIVIVNLYSASSGEAPQRHSRPNKTKNMIKKDGLQTAAEERQRQSKEFRTEAARQSIPKRWTNNGKAPALGRSQPNLGHDQITLLSRTERPAAGIDDTGTQIEVGDGPCIGPPNILRSSVVGWARKHEQSKKVVVKKFSSEIVVFLVKKGSYTTFDTVKIRRI